MIATSSLFMTGTGKKPFNPILGETFQGHYSGDPIYIEQVSHHPPITCFFFEGKQYVAYGSFNPDPKLEGNKILLNNYGTYSVTFKNTSNKVEHNYLSLRLNGLLFGKTIINIA